MGMNATISPINLMITLVVLKRQAFQPQRIDTAPEDQGSN